MFPAWVFFIMLAASTDLVRGLGVNWGQMSSHPLPPTDVVKMLKVNGIKKVKLFDADPKTMKALAGSGLDVMVGIPNDKLDKLSHDYELAQKWVKENVTEYLYKGGVSIRFANIFFLVNIFCLKTCSSKEKKLWFCYGIIIIFFWLW